MSKIIRKVLSDDYTFDTSGGAGLMTVTINDISGFETNQIVEVRNLSTGDILCAGVKFKDGINRLATVSNDIITLGYDDTTTISTMDDADVLSVVINEEEIAYDKNLDVLKNSIQSADWGSKNTDSEPLVTSKILTTSFVDMGSEIQMIGYNQLGVRLTVDINDATDVEFRVLHKHESGGSEEYREVYLGASASNITTINLNDYQLGTDSNQLIKINIPFDGTTPYVQLQARMLTDGGADAIISTAYITKAFAS